MSLPAGSVLVVDDSSDDTFFTIRLLESSGFAGPFHTSPSGAEAIELLKGTLGADIRLAFLDIRMPMMDGHELLIWIRSQPRLAHLRVIMLSTSDESSDITRARNLGASGYLVKHPATPKLLAILESIDPALVPEGVTDSGHARRT